MGLNQIKKSTNYLQLVPFGFFVTLTEQFTNHFMNDLKKLAYFSIDL